MTDRLGWSDRLWRRAFEVAKDSTCDRARHGCVVAKADTGVIIVTGYNGSVDGEPHCDEAGHQVVAVMPTSKLLAGGQYVADTDCAVAEYHCIRTIHAEQNAIVNACLLGVGLFEADWYITGVPCWTCAKMIARLRPNHVRMCSERGEEDITEDRRVSWWIELFGSSWLNDMHAVPFDNLKERGVVPSDFPE